MISFRVKFLVFNNFKFIVGMLKFFYIVYLEVYVDFNFGNMMYFIKNVIREILYLLLKFWGKEVERRLSFE